MTEIQSLQLLIVTTSFSRIEDARLMAQKLLDERLAACVQIQEGTLSMYRWHGKLSEENEVLLSAKTAACKWDEISAFIKQHHPYELPELLGISPAEFDVDYGDWVKSEIKIDT
ncbi:divalent cation tolerance protein [Polynucleobacter meluiroseus]|uniref:Divalent cation tolerance protein n=1 Tax=Polynucleobacter meluiroseus TaxID=1938814 RepID=A0A240E1S5_9BURK|nr:divalent-cation tolerance protein CutA [Polynucleobacter meluiroseus]SNX28874.1 divalent cation tolerance protein [Polynucleobacter meluiroseus]